MNARVQPADGSYEAIDAFDDAYDEGAGFDFREIFAILRRNRLLLAGITLLALALGVTATMLTTPLYKATATIQIEQRTAAIIEDSGLEPGVPASDTNRFLQTQIDILKSRVLADRVRESLGLDRDDKFIVAMGSKPPKVTGHALVAARQGMITGLLTSNLEVKIPSTSRIATITFTSPDRRLAARIANSYVDNFIQSTLVRRVEASSYARRYLQNEIETTKERLETSEQRLLGYARSQGLIDNSGPTPTSISLSGSNLSVLNDAYAAARIKRLDAEQHWRQAQSMPLMAVPEVVNDPLIRNLLQDRSAKAIALEQVKSRYQPDHPSVSQANALLVSLDREIANQATNIRKSLGATYQGALSQESSLQSDVDKLRNVSLDEQGRRVGYNTLKREVDTNRTMYDALLQRYKELAAASGISLSNISSVDTAAVPARPSEPNLASNLLIALVIGLGLAGVVIFARERFDDVIRTPDEVLSKLQLPLLGSIPLVPRDSEPQAELSDPQSALSEAYHSLRTAIEFSTISGAPRSLLFTSSSPGEGKSTSAVAIAQGFARLDRRVLLIDGDLRKPSLHRLLGLSAKTGLANLLTGQLSLEEVIQKTDMPGVDFVACGPLPPNPTELLSSNSLPELLRGASEHYNLVLIDGPPVMGLADAQLLAREVDAVSFVVEAGRAHRGQAKTAVRRLLISRAHLIGAVLTKFDAQRSGYGYGYGYGYAYSYKYGERKPEPA